MDPFYPFLLAMAVSLALIQLNQRLVSPVIAIVNRWLRWLIFSFGGAYLLFQYEVLDRPYWALVCVCFLGWFLIETIYNWMMVSALSQSTVSLFPTYSINPGGDEWPMQKRFLNVRDLLRFKGYRHVQALRSEIGGGLYLRCSFYEHPENKSRIQLFFMPQPNGSISLGCVATSLTASGLRIVTDNLHIPFAGYYPGNWHVERRPMTRCVLKLVEYHQERVLDTGDQVVPFEVLPSKDVEVIQRELDMLNTEMGFLVPYREREELGKITHEGRYRLWKEIWMLEYLGRSVRYY